MIKRYFLGSALGIISSISLASPSIWTDNNGLGAVTAAAKFSITAGGTPITSIQTTIKYYTDINCTNLASSDTNTNGSYTFNPSSSVQANAISIWNLSGFNAGVQSIKVIPTYAGGDVFTTTPCFTVACGAGQCVYSGAPVSVTLN